MAHPTTVKYSADPDHECFVTMTHAEARSGGKLKLWPMGHVDRFDGNGGYDSRCTSCWLGHPHTVEAHRANMELHWANVRESERRVEALHAKQFPNSSGF